jgi:hypothetical protein
VKGLRQVLQHDAQPSGAGDDGHASVDTPHRRPVRPYHPGKGRSTVNNGNPGGLDTRTTLLLVAGGIGTYIAFLHPTFGVALMVGIYVMATLDLLSRSTAEALRPSARRETEAAHGLPAGAPALPLRLLNRSRTG